MLSGLSFIVLCISIILFWCQANSKSIQKRVFYGRPRHKRSAESDVNGKIVNNIERKCDDKREKAPGENIHTLINSKLNTNEIKDDYYYQSFNVVQEIFNELEPLENYEDFCKPNNLGNSDFCSRSEIYSGSTSNISNDFYAANKRADNCEEMINELLSDNIGCIEGEGTGEADRIEEYINELRRCLFNTDTPVIVSFISFYFFTIFSNF